MKKDSFIRVRICKVTRSPKENRHTESIDKIREIIRKHMPPNYEHHPYYLEPVYPDFSICICHYLGLSACLAIT